MIGIQNIGLYICNDIINNLNRIFNNEKVDPEFISKKIGIEQVSRMSDSEQTSDLCIKAYDNLLSKIPNLNIDEIGLICVCTQNGDYSIPHTSAVMHHKLNMPKECAAFDISLGCSGYVYSMDIVKSFMEKNGIKKGLLFTADPYSHILDENDKNTNLIFGDAATVTLLSDEPVFTMLESTYHTFGNMHEYLIKKENTPLFMDGKMIFNFSLEYVPSAVNTCLTKNKCSVDDIDLFIMHQANKYMVSKLVKRMKLDITKVPIDIKDYGNTVSSSIPIILSSYLNHNNINTILLCGFGVGLSIAATIISKIK